MKAAIIFLITAIATIGTAKCQVRTVQGKINHTPGLHIQLIDGSTDGRLPIAGGKVLLITGKDTISMTTGRDGQVSFTKRIDTPTIVVISEANGFATRMDTMKTPSPTTASNRTLYMRKPKN